MIGVRMFRDGAMDNGPIRRKRWTKSEKNPFCGRAAQKKAEDPRRLASGGWVAKTH